MRSAVLRFVIILRFKKEQRVVPGFLNEHPDGNFHLLDRGIYG
jgi:hypothetical protein